MLAVLTYTPTREVPVAGRPIMEDVERTLIEKYGGDEWVFDQIAGGRAVGDIAQDLGISRRYLYNWRDQARHKDRRRRLWHEAMKFSAEAHAEKGLSGLTNLHDGERIPFPAEVTLATSEANYRKWLASRRDPEGFGDKKETLQINIGDLHLQALERQGPPPRLSSTPVPEEIEEGDFQMIEDGQDENELAELFE